MLKGIHFRATDKAQQTIENILKEHPKFNQTEAINYALEAFQSEPQQSDSSFSPTLDTEVPCFSRYEHEGEYFCVNRKAHAQKLETLKICAVCQWRLTQEKAIKDGLLLRTKHYVICGAKEHHDKKKGLMLYCSKFYQGQWVTPEQCKDAKCILLKEVKTT